MSLLDQLLDKHEHEFWMRLGCDPEPGEELILVICPECQALAYHMSFTLFWQCEECQCRCDWRKAPHRVLFEREEEVGR